MVNFFLHLVLDGFGVEHLPLKLFLLTPAVLDLLHFLLDALHRLALSHIGPLETVLEVLLELRNMLLVQHLDPAHLLLASVVLLKDQKCLLLGYLIGKCTVFFESLLGHIYDIMGLLDSLQDLIMVHLLALLYFILKLSEPLLRLKCIKVIK